MEEEKRRPDGGTILGPMTNACRPFSVAEARAQGLTRRDLEKPGIVRLHHGIYAPAAVAAKLSVRAEAAVRRSGPRCHLSHHTAGLLWGLWVPDDPRIHVTMPPGGNRHASAGLAMHRGHDDDAVQRLRGLPVSTPVQVVRDLAPMLPLVDRVVLIDSVLSSTAATREEIADGLMRWPARSARPSQAALALARDRVESPRESQLRVLVVLAGLPEPEVNYRLRDPASGRAYRLDLAYPELQVGIEYDGRQHAVDPGQYRRDVDRREVLARLDWRVVTVVAEHLFHDPAGVIDRVAAARSERGARDGRLGDDWRAHYVQRRIVG